jgi:DNA-binding transcriptional regulator YiaG
MVAIAIAMGQASCDKGLTVCAMTKPLIPMLIEARRHLDLSQGELGMKLGYSRRTGQRWERGGSPPGPEELHILAALVHPHSAELSADLAGAGGTTLEALGIVPPPLPTSAPAPPADGASPAPPPPVSLPDPIHIVDTVVCAAAEAIQIMPGAIRPALRAAFRRARLAGLSVEDVDAALHPEEKVL